MDGNNLIGFILMMALLFVYFVFFSPEPVPPTVTNTTTTDSTLSAGSVAAPVATDTALTAAFGGAVRDTTSRTLENSDLKLQFSPTGVLQRAELKGYKTYLGKPLVLLSPATSSLELKTAISGKEADLFQLPSTAETTSGADGTTVRFTAASADGSFIRHIWTLPAKGFVVKYRLETSSGILQRENLELLWTNRMPLVEKDINDSRGKTAINFRTADGETNGTSDTSVDPESEIVPAGSSWVGMKQKFFLSAVLSSNGFAGGNVETRVDPADEQTVKTGVASLKVPAVKSSSGGVQLDFYVGPNDYKNLDEIAEGFETNVYLGWPPVKWVNQYFIVPLFYLLTKLTTSYGLIIIILVIVIRLVLLPLSYKSYLGMAKMRLLKPELDELKKKYPDDQMKFSQEQMKLFSEAGASPFAGCIPLLLQMPILFAMFYLFPSCIEFRQQTLPFAEDISTYDSVLSLPFTIPFLGNHLSIYTLLMTISTLVITWQNNQMSTVDGPMKSLSYIMPVIFLFVLNSFPASLSFYYLAGNIASFVQQILIRRFVDEDKIRLVMETHRKKMAANPNSGKSPFMSRLNDALKASEEARRTAEEAKKKSKRS